MTTGRISRVATWTLGLFGLWIAADVAGVNAQGAGAPPEMDLTIRQQTAVPAGERLGWVQENESRARSTYRRVQGLLDEARQEKDSIKITCLDDKLTQIHVNLSGIEERKEALAAAIEGGDSLGADQEFTVLSIYMSRISGLEAEADNCIGDSDVVVGESETVATVSDDVTQEDPTQDGQDVYQDVGTDPLPHASGYY